jgi:hypothetical protein
VHKTARVLAAELAAAGHDSAEGEDDSQPLRPFDDVALARFLLRVAAPSDPAAPAAPSELALYERQRLVSRRLWALCFPPFVIVAIVRRLIWPVDLPAAAAAVAPPALPTFHQAWAIYQNSQQVPRQLVLLAIHVGLVLFVTLPRLCGLYKSHGLLVMRIFSVLQFIMLPAVAEWRVRRSLGFTVIWPPLQGVAFATSITVNMALLPLPCRDSVALLLLRWAQMVLARLTDAPVWPQVRTPVQAALATTVVHATLVAAVVAMDRRAWAAWRAGRRARLAEALPRMRKQA